MNVELSKEQLKIINNTDSHLAVIAGAGTGKTTILTKKIQKLITDGINPTEILAITFTKKAANEMVKRIKNSNVRVSTFDAYCYNLINKELNINIIEDNIPFFRKEVLSFHLYDANLKNGLKPRNYDKYVSYKKQNNFHDFNDIAYLSMPKLSSHHFSHILVDEFQDTNELQLKVLKTLITKDVKSFIVGDPDQSIYRFRGAKKEVFNDYINKYQASVLTLSFNYRSNKKIINAANNLIKYNKKRIKKLLISKRTLEGGIYFYSFKEQQAETDFIIHEISKYHNKTIAILYRNHSMAYELRIKLYDSINSINLLSIHEAKGLEFDVVFLIGLNKDIFPSYNIKQISYLEEERRLMFVALTRAKLHLYLITKKHHESLFIKEIQK